MKYPKKNLSEMKSNTKPVQAVMAPGERSLADLKRDASDAPAME